MLSLNQLPVEVLHIVFYYIDIPDILRIRRVSQFLNKATYHWRVWADAYRTAQFVRPPGPFPSQSLHDLENALNTSLRVHRNICCCGGATDAVVGSTLNVREIPYVGPLRHPRVKLVFGRFLLVASSEEVHCYDLNRDKSVGARIIYQTTHGVLRSFHRVSAIDNKGRTFSCVVLSEATKTMSRTLICSPNAGQQSELTLDIIHQFEHDTFEVQWVDLGPRIIVITGRVGHYPNWEWHLVALDVHTRTRFFFDISTPATWGSNEVQHRRTTPSCISTSTHVVLAWSTYTHAAGWSTFFQAFALPTLNPYHSTATSTTLSPSHHGIIPGISAKVCGTLLLHDAVFDPSTQDVLISIRVLEFESSRPRAFLSRHGTLRLNNIHIPSDNEVGTITLEVHGPLSTQGNVLVFHPSFNGIGRVFYTFKNVLWALEYDLHARGNGDEEQETRVTNDYPILRFMTQHTLLDYDAWSGRVCFESTTGDDTVIKVWDFSV